MEPEQSNYASEAVLENDAVAVLRVFGPLESITIFAVVTMPSFLLTLLRSKSELQINMLERYYLAAEEHDAALTTGRHLDFF
jgi:hypothetical protein